MAALEYQMATLRSFFGPSMNAAPVPHGIGSPAVLPTPPLNGRPYGSFAVASSSSSGRRSAHQETRTVYSQSPALPPPPPPPAANSSDPGLYHHVYHGSIPSPASSSSSSGPPRPFQPRQSSVNDHFRSADGYHATSTRSPPRPPVRTNSHSSSSGGVNRSAPSPGLSRPLPPILAPPPSPPSLPSPSSYGGGDRFMPTGHAWNPPRSTLPFQPQPPTPSSSGVTSLPESHKSRQQYQQQQQQQQQEQYPQPAEPFHPGRDAAAEGNTCRHRNQTSPSAKEAGTRKEKPLPGEDECCLGIFECDSQGRLIV